ncbi:hypothetical protein JOS77_26950 [Chromobacterium haemolyticum]|nr:hypothetical protein JOS77_26950 [Chromobacterium haemolyticum]
MDPGYCAKQPACIKQTQLFMVHHAAFEQRNPKHLTPIYSSIQASITAIIQQILQTIIADGVKLEAPAWAVTREGDIVIGEYNDFDTGEKRIIMETKAHPLLKPLQEFLSRNNLALSDMGMTPKAIEQEEQQMGRLAPAGEGQKTLTMEDYAAKQADPWLPSKCWPTALTPANSATRCLLNISSRTGASHERGAHQRRSAHQGAAPG